MFDRKLDALGIRIRVGDEPAEAAGPAQGFLVIQTAAERKGCPFLPAGGDVVPASVERILGTRPGDGQLAVDRGTIVALEKGCLTGFKALGLQNHAGYMAPAGCFKIGIWQARATWILPVPKRIKPALVARLADARELHLGADIDRRAGRPFGNEFDAGRAFERHREMDIVYAFRRAQEQ